MDAKSPGAAPISLWHAGRGLAYKLAKVGKEWRNAAAVRMPEARGDIREIVGQPVFVPLQKLATIYGKACSCQHLAFGCMPQVVLFSLAESETEEPVASQVFRLSFGPKSFVVVSDAQVARHILFTNAPNYSKGVLSEILDFVMGTGEVIAK